MNINDEVKTNDGKVGRICDITDQHRYHHGIFHVEVDAIHHLILDYLEWQLTPIPPEEKREWFYMPRWALGLMTKGEVTSSGKDYIQDSHDCGEVRLFRWPDGEVIE